MKGIFIFIDDDTAEHRFFEKALGKITDAEIKFASNGEEGLELIKEHLGNIFIIISDINMPKLNGLELKRIIEGTPLLKLKSIPFIFHSAHDNAVVIKEAYALGIQGFIKKSYDMTESVKNLEGLIHFWGNTVVHPNTID